MGVGAGLYMYNVIVEQFTFAISPPDEFLSEWELTFTFAICYRPSVRLSVCLSSVCRLSVTLVHPTQAVEIFGIISTALGTLAIR